jgi:four helix bundle protein
MDSKARTYQFAVKIIGFMDKLPNDMTTRILAVQLLRAATSIGANIMEAQASPTRKDFANYFSHSLKSAYETKYWLRLLQDVHKADSLLIDDLLKEADEIGNILGASIMTLRGKRRL